MSQPSDFVIQTLGSCSIDSPISDVARGQSQTPRFVEDGERILLEDRVLHLNLPTGQELAASLELAGPRRKIFVNPAESRAGIVTCGGLCPGLNDVIRGLTMELYYRYGVKTIYGFRYGYLGLTPGCEHQPMMLDPELVSDSHERGGTILGSSRGEQDPVKMVDRLVELKVNMLFVIGGDGTLRGASALAAEVRRRGLTIAIMGVPKTIDNDILFLDRSFGFETAYSHAVEAIYCAHNEARGALNGVGLVKIMGRHSGFLACHAALATSHVNFVLIPEMPLMANSGKVFMEALRDRLARRKHAVILVAEGLGDQIPVSGEKQKDASGNTKFQDIGPYMAGQIGAYFRGIGMECNLKYIDPSYTVRSVRAIPSDSIYCWRLAQNAVHAAMCGKTEMVIGCWHGRFVHVPIMQAIAGRNCVDPQGDLWLSVLESTAQPAVL